jgi:Stress responsive A/B Barrel Domain
VPNTSKTDFDIALYSEFESYADLDIYQEHPEHLKVASFIGKVRTARAAVDYIV